MARTESSRIALRNHLASRRERFTPSERLSADKKRTILDVDFRAYAQSGITTLLFDAEGTFVGHNGWDIDPKVQKKIREAREVGINNIAIITNKTPKDEFSFVQLNWWAHQIGADVVITPEMRQDRKPSPNMLHMGMQYFEVGADKVMMIGDKLSADIVAANAAGVRSIYVDKLGKGDHPGDKLFRRPWEQRLRGKLARQQEGERTTGESTLQSEEIIFQQRELDDLPHPLWFGKVDERLRESHRIANMPGGKVIPRPKPAETDGSEIVQEAKRRINEHVYEHGRVYANGLTKFRRVAGWGEAGLILTGHYKVARVVDPIVGSTDIADGWLARGHKDGGTSDGAAQDGNADKERDIVRMVAQVITGKLKARHLLVRVGADIATQMLRRHYKDYGVDVKAGVAGKISTLVQGVAINTALSDRNPESVQYAADVAKIVRVPIYLYKWHEEKESLPERRKMVLRVVDIMVSSQEAA